MIVHVFNSSVVSGPETLVIPALRGLGEKVAVVFLSETRKGNLSDEPPAYAARLGLEVHEVTVRSRWDMRAVRELRALLARLSPRIVHAHEVKAAAYLAAAAGTQPSYRLFTTNHGIRAKRAPKLRFYEWLFTHVIMPRFDRVLCVCSSDRELLIRRGVPAAKVSAHLNGIDRRKVARDSRATESHAIRALWKLPGLGDSSLCLGVVGRLAPEKRHAYILRVFRELLACEPSADAHLVIVGRGALDDELKAESKRLELEERVHWLGYRSTAGEEMAGFDALLSLSIAEGLPINVVEAGWAGTAVVATAVDGNLDLMPGPEYGLLFPVEATESAVAEGLARLVREPELRSRMGLMLQSRVEKEFSGARWLETLKALYG